MARKNIEIDINNILEDYKEQLKLMDKQHGLEDELYPWIYMFLWASGKVNNLSMRQVAGASWADSVLGREMLRGYAGFPDFAILDKEFCTINLDKNIDDMTEFVKEWIEKENSIKEDSKEIINKLKNHKKIDDKIKEFLRKYWYLYNIDKIKGCVECKILGDELVKIENKESILKINCEQDKWMIVLEEGDTNQKYTLLKNKTELSNAGQLFGELLWYGRVLYTNGNEWKFLEVTKCYKKIKNDEEKEIRNIIDLRKELYDDYVKLQKPSEKWYKRISALQNDELEIKIRCGSLSNGKLFADKERNILSWLGGYMNFYERKFTVEDYFEQLKLMEKQFGQEEELYPFIYIFLNIRKEKDKSVRVVAKGRKNEKCSGTKLIKGGISFPDIALFNKEFDKNKDYEYNKNYLLGCVEAKKMSKDVLDKINGDIDINIIKEKVIIAKPSSKRPRYYCEAILPFNNVNSTEDKILIIKAPEILEEKNVEQLKEKFATDFEEWNLINNNNCNKANKFYCNIDNNDFFAFCEERICLGVGKQLTYWYKKNDEYKEGLTDVGQIFGELFWYGKVLYTNGLVWKYLEVTKCGEKYTGNEARLYLRKQIYDNCIKGDKKWYEIINDKKVKIKCADIADLTKGYNTYKDNKELTSDHIKQWDDLINGLADIKWLPQSEQTKED